MYHMREGSERAREFLQRTRIPQSLSCDMSRFRKSSCCSVQQSEEMKRNEVRAERGRVRDSKRETRTNCYQIKFVSPLWRSAEEDELHYLAAMI